VQPPRKSVGRFLKKLKIEVLYDSAIPFLGIYPKECRSAYNGDTYTKMFLYLFCFERTVGEESLLR
jgi:hypothetical protein